MRRGGFDKRVTLHRRTMVRDPATGEMVETWARLGEVWAEKVSDTAIERYATAQKIAEVTDAFRLDWRPGLVVMTPDEHRLTQANYVYDVKGVQEIARRSGVMVFCSARAEGLTALGEAPEA